MGGTVAANDRLARFVGIEAYVAVGGAIVRDLFDAEDDGYLADAALVQRLATAKLEAALVAVRAEGWTWVRADLSRDYGVGYGRVWQQLDEETGEDSGDEAEPAFTPADMARAGALVTLGRDGDVQIERGLIHPDDRKAEGRTARVAVPADPAALAASLVTDLSAHRTAALRVELARNPAVALAVTVHALALPLLYSQHHSSCLAIRASKELLDRHTTAAGDCSAHDAMRQQAEFWGDRLPGAATDLFAWCLSQPQEVLLDLLAFVAALTVDAIEIKGNGRSAAADELAAALSLDMRAWWTPSVEGFYRRLPKAGLIHVMGEAGVTAPAPLASVKKAEAAQMVATAMQGSGWLPAPLRTQTDMAA